MKIKIILLTVLLVMLISSNSFAKREAPASSPGNSQAVAAKETLKVPNPSVNIKPEDVSLINERVLDITLKRLDSTIYIFGILITAIVVLAGASIGLMNYISTKNSREDFKLVSENITKEMNLNKKELSSFVENFKREVNFEEHFKAWKLEMQNKIQQEINEVPTLVNEEIKKLFEQQYREAIFDYTKPFAHEVLMMTPSARDLLLSRLNSFNMQITNCFDAKISEAARKTIASVIQDWHTLDQLFSPDEEQLKIGINTVRATPFVEAHTRLLILLERYKGMPHKQEFIPLITNAIEAVENHITKKRKSL